jgi:transposase
MRCAAERSWPRSALATSGSVVWSRSNSWRNAYPSGCRSVETTRRPLACTATPLTRLRRRLQRSGWYPLRSRQEVGRSWLELARTQLAPKSETAAAIHDALGLWGCAGALSRRRPHRTGDLIAERALRPVTIGRRNYLCAGSDAGGRRAAILYTPTATARLNGLAPEAYLHFVIARVGEHPIKRIEELLPWNVAGTLVPALQQAG